MTPLFDGVKCDDEEEYFMLIVQERKVHWLKDFLDKR